MSICGASLQKGGQCQKITDGGLCKIHLSSRRTKYEIDKKAGINWCKGYDKGCDNMAELGFIWCIDCREKRREREKALRQRQSSQQIVVLSTPTTIPVLSASKVSPSQSGTSIQSTASPASITIPVDIVKNGEVCRYCKSCNKGQGSYQPITSFISTNSVVLGYKCNECSGTSTHIPLQANKAPVFTSGNNGKQFLPSIAPTSIKTESTVTIKPVVDSSVPCKLNVVLNTQPVNTSNSLITTTRSVGRPKIYITPEDIREKERLKKQKQRAQKKLSVD